MKKIRLISLLLAALMLTSCGVNNDKDAMEENEVFVIENGITEEMKEVSRFTCY